MTTPASRALRPFTMLGCATAAALLLAAPNAHALCAGFPDVAADGFCPNVEWIKNRQVTLGCLGGNYCPDGFVTRLQMAAFMNRLGTALTPVRVGSEVATGAMDLDVNPVVCATDPLAIINFPRRAFVDGALSATGTVNTGFAADLVMSKNDGPWEAMNTLPSRGSVLANQWASVSDIAYVDLDVGDSVRWGLRASRGGIAPGGDLTDGRCQVRSLVYSRDGTTSPF